MWRPHDKVHLETGLFDHFNIKIMGHDWEHLDKDKKDKKDKEKKESCDQPWRKPVSHWEVCNHDEYISQMSQWRNDIVLNNFFIVQPTAERFTAASCR